ncbi:MAG: ABC transporter ATP-binding protein [Lactobacillus sp.]|nr:ABC transporter ATP-binding protein [Lactobacillus sp.]
MKTFKKILILLKPYTKSMLGISFLMLLTTCINLLIPILQQRIIDDAILESNLGLLLKLLVIIIGLCLLTSLISYTCAKIQTRINYDLNEKLQLKVFSHALKLKIDYIKDQGIFKICKDADQCIESIGQITDSTVFSLFLETFQFIGIIVALAFINWRLTLLGLLVVPCRAIVSWLISKRTYAYSDQNLENHRILHRWEDDSFTSVIDIKLWNLYQQKTNEYNSILKNRNKNLIRLEKLNRLDELLGTSLNNIVFNFIYLIAGFLIWKKSITIGGLLVFISYFNYLLEPVNIFATLSILLADVAPSVDKWYEFLALEEEDFCDNNLSQKERTEFYKNASVNIEFKDVSFSYGERKILQDVNFKINAGEKIAIVGENGSGKTTLINLLLRFIKPTNGTIDICNLDISKIGIEQYRELFGVVTQSPTLFDATIADNLTLFDKYLLSDNILSSPLLKFVKLLDKGLESRVGNKSSFLSGGEKQKIVLVRAIIANKKILVLDEPTSNYDKDSEELFNEMIKTGNRNQIFIVITHEPSIIKSVDKILHVNNSSVTVYDSADAYLSHNK